MLSVHFLSTRQKDLLFQIKKGKNTVMYILKRVWIVICVCILISGCSGISLTPSFYSDGKYIYVHKGDTLYGLAKENNIPMRDLIRENKLKAPYNLYVGQKLRIPSPKTHTVQKGETLYSISKKYEMSISALSRMNNLNEPYTLFVGQKLKVNNTSTTSSSAQSVKTTAKSQKTTKRPQKTTYKTQSKPQKTVSIPQSQSRKRFNWPVKGKVVSSFGATYKKRQNDGINIAAAKGTTVKAADSGTVGYAGNQLKGYGNLILIRHNNGWMTAYAHNDKILVKKGQKVQKGQRIATVGQTGNVTSPQLHFEIRYKTKVVNPKKYLQ